MLVVNLLVFSIGDECFWLIYFASAVRCEVGCDRWRLPWRLIRELSHSISVQCFIMTSLFMFPFLFYLSFCPYLYITFAMLLCLVCVCLSITFLAINIFLLYTHMAPTPLHTHWDIRPYTQVCVRHGDRRSICGHVGSPTRLITVKPHLEFSPFDNALSLVVPTATMLLPKKMISLKASKVTCNHPWEFVIRSGLLVPFH